MVIMRNFLVFALALVFAFAGLATFSGSADAGNHAQDDILAQGRYIATVAGCTSCHTPDRAEYQNPQTLTIDQIKTLAFDGNDALDVDKFLAGGRAFPLGPAGVVFSRNITPDETTGIGTWTDEQVKIAMKTGLNAKGETLFPVMPYHVYSTMADSDVEAVVAFIRSVSAVSNAVPPKTVSTEGMPTLPYQQGFVAPAPSDMAARGAYLVNSVTGCTDCHTPVDPATGAPQMDKYLAGRQPYEGPWGIVYGGNITPDVETGIGDWSEEDIKRAIVSGVAKDGRRLILMPWYAYAALTPEDVDAIVFYLRNDLPAVSNEIPAAALNPDFVVMAPEALATEEADNIFASPLVVVGMGVLIILITTGGLLWFRRRNS
jgi:mono/diheme cytochrome c family protein